MILFLLWMRSLIIVLLDCSLCTGMLLIFCVVNLYPVTCWTLLLVLTIFRFSWIFCIIILSANNNCLEIFNRLSYIRLNKANIFIMFLTSNTSFTINIRLRRFLCIVSLLRGSQQKVIQACWFFSCWSFWSFKKIMRFSLICWCDNYINRFKNLFICNWRIMAL